MSINVVAENIFCFRTAAHRSIEDWRKNSPASDQGPWAVVCTNHNERRFVQSYKTAKAWADSPFWCPACSDFDNGCSFCKRDLATWQADPTKGFTKSIGHIQGRCCCEQHKYGAIPERVDYSEVTDVVNKKLIVSVYIGGLFVGPKVAEIRYMNGDRTYWLVLQHAIPFTSMSVDSAREYSAAISFATTIAYILTGQLTYDPTAKYPNPPGMETWEEATKRRELELKRQEAQRG